MIAIEESDAPPGELRAALARAAIEAMREPTGEMVDAIVDISPDRPHADYWRAGVDAALAG
jgi:hypothetical protein